MKGSVRNREASNVFTFRWSLAININLLRVLTILINWVNRMKSSTWASSQLNNRGRNLCLLSLKITESPKKKHSDKVCWERKKCFRHQNVVNFANQRSPFDVSCMKLQWNLKTVRNASRVTYRLRIKELIHINTKDFLLLSHSCLCAMFLSLKTIFCFITYQLIALFLHS